MFSVTTIDWVQDTVLNPKDLDLIFLSCHTL